MKISKKALQSIDDLCYLKVMIQWCEENMEKEQSIDVLIAFIADKFDFVLKNFSVKTLNNLNIHLFNKDIIEVEDLEKIILEFTNFGIVSLKNQWLRFNYLDTVFDRKATTVLEINGSEYESRYLSDEQIKTFEDKLLILFDKERFDKATIINKVIALYHIFKSPRMSEFSVGYNTMLDAVLERKEIDDIPEDKLLEYKQNMCNKIIKLYLRYLWKNSKKDLKYVYSFDSWISKNKYLWGENIDNLEESLNLFIDEHKEIINIFNSVNEPNIIYICGRKKQESLYKEDCQKGITTNGQDGM
jgi:hypothetical protein